MSRHTELYRPDHKTAAASLWLDDLVVTVFVSRFGADEEEIRLPDGTPDRLDRAMAKRQMALYAIGAEACGIPRADRPNDLNDPWWPMTERKAGRLGGD